ncbi:thiol-disulfide oxidoreductase DCC family protein [Chryseobacterium sp. S-02]|uniref:thiol-disulfide oxidoreductase DCC family protein n=1 Tax=Chryseobacterium sp. S-02 TaxID=3404064 RepID=UPI003CF3A68C
MREDILDKHIIFFDGECGVCNFWVQWILENDKKDKFMFASLQSDFGQRFLTERGLETQQFNTLYLWKPQQYYLIKSKAVLKITNILGGFYKLLSVFGKIFPTSFSNKIYDLISENRMKIASQKCFLPDSHQKKKFIEI